MFPQFAPLLSTVHATLDKVSVVVYDVEVDIEVVVIQYNKNLPLRPSSVFSLDILFVVDGIRDFSGSSIPSKLIVLLFLFLPVHDTRAALEER